jgi:hypothetical protein
VNLMLVYRSMQLGHQSLIVTRTPARLLAAGYVLTVRGKLLERGAMANPVANSRSVANRSGIQDGPPTDVVNLATHVHFGPGVLSFL